MGTRRRKQCKSLQVAIGCFREKVYYTLSESRALSSPIGNRYAGRSRDLSHLRQVVPYRRSLFRRSAMNCLSPYAHFAPYGCRLRQLSRSCCRRSLDDVNFAAKPRALAPPTEVSPFWRKYMRPLLCLIFFRSFVRFSLDQTTLFTSLKLYKFPFFSSNEDLLSSLTPHLG